MANPEMTIAEAFKMGPTVYGGAEPAAHKLVRTYRAFRQYDNTATLALDKTRVALTTGKPRYPTHGKGRLGAPFVNGGGRYGDTLRWVEKPESVGLRLVWQEPRGWRAFGAGASDEQFCGVVFLLPGRKGRCQLVAGYLDPNQDGPAAVCFDEVFARSDTKHSHDSVGDYRESQALRDAKHSAGEIARIACESQREADEADALEQETEDLTQLVTDLRAERRSLIAEVRASGGLPPSVCDTLRKRIYSIRRESREAHKRLAAIESGIA